MENSAKLQVLGLLWAVDFIVLAPAAQRTSSHCYEPWSHHLHLMGPRFFTGCENLMPLHFLQGTCNIEDFYHLLSQVVSIPGWSVPAYSDILVPNQLPILENTCCSPWIFLVIKKKVHQEREKENKEREKERSNKYSQPHVGLVCKLYCCKSLGENLTMCLSTSVPAFQTFPALFENTPANVFCDKNSLKHNF